MSEPTHHRRRRRPSDRRRAATTLARRHLWMHFSRLGALRRARDADHGAGRGLLRLGRDAASSYLDALSGLFTVQVGSRPAPSSPSAAREAGRDARVLPDLELRAPAGDRARGHARRARARRPRPRLLHHRRLRGGRVGVEARPPVLPRRSARPAPQGDRPRHRVPRHDAGRARDHRRPGAARRRSSR